MNINPHITGDERFDRTPADESMSPISVADVIEWLTGFLGRQYLIFAIGLACALAAGIAYLSVAPPQYTATALLMIDRGKVRDLQVPGSSLGDGPLDTVQVDTQVEVLRSDTIGLAVIRAQNLMEDPELNDKAKAATNPLAKLFSLFKSNARSEPPSAKAVLGSFLSRRKIVRVGKTYILEISYQSSDPVHAANIANAIADAYIDNELETKYQVTRRASTWLQGRIKELRSQAADADLAVFEYKERNKIIDYGNISVSGPGAASGRLIGDQQLSELNSQLMATRGATAEAKARLDRIEDVLKQDVRDATVADTLKNEIINRLRTQYLDMAATGGELVRPVRPQPSRRRQSAHPDGGAPALDGRRAQPHRRELPQRVRDRQGAGGGARAAPHRTGQRKPDHLSRPHRTGRPGERRQGVARDLRQLPAALPGGDAAAVLPDHRGAGDHAGRAALQQEFADRRAGAGPRRGHRLHPRPRRGAAARDHRRHVPHRAPGRGDAAGAVPVGAAADGGGRRGRVKRLFRPAGDMDGAAAAPANRQTRRAARRRARAGSRSTTR